MQVRKHMSGGVSATVRSGRRAARASRGAFTLIELLVVIAILGLLVAMLLPALAKAKEAGRVVLCASNLHSIGLAWEMYLNDTTDTFPLFYKNMWWFYGGRHPSIWTGGFALDFRPLNPYVATSMAVRGQPVAEVFHCPADREIRDEVGRPAVTKGYPTFDYYGNCYPLNSMLLQRFNPATGLPVSYTDPEPFRRTEVRIPHAMTVLAGDCQWYYSVNDAKWDAHFHNRNDKVNLLFLDGHVAFTQIVRGSAVTGTYSFLTWPADAEE